MVRHNKTTKARPQRFTLRKEEILSGSKDLQRVFQRGRVIAAGVIRCHYYSFKTGRQQNNSLYLRVGFSVPQRLIKRAVYRNRIRRLLRESYRLNKQILVATLMEKKLCVDLVLVIRGDTKKDYRRLTLQKLAPDVVRCFEILLERLEEKTNS